jgi:hypothetical protein
MRRWICFGLCPFSIHSEAQACLSACRPYFAMSIMMGSPASSTAGLPVAGSRAWRRSNMMPAAIWMGWKPRSIRLEWLSTLPNPFGNAKSSAITGSPPASFLPVSRLGQTSFHDGATVVAVAGYISRPKHWRAWTKDWNAAKKPIKVFHSTDCANFRKEFDGWDKVRRDAYVANLLPVLPRHELAGIVIGIDMDVFRRELAQLPDLKRMLGEPYAACFQWAVSIIMDIASGHGKGEPMAFVHENNDFPGEAQRAFQYVRDNLNLRGIKMTMAFGAKEGLSASSGG